MKNNKLMIAAVISLIALACSMFILNMESKTTMFDIVPYENDAKIEERQVDTEKTAWNVAYQVSGTAFRDIRTEKEWKIIKNDDSGETVFCQELSGGSATCTRNGERLHTFMPGKLDPDALRVILYGEMNVEPGHDYMIYGTDFSDSYTKISRTLTGGGSTYYYDFRTGLLTVWRDGVVKQVLDISDLEAGTDIKKEIKYLGRSGTTDFIAISSMVILLGSIIGMIVNYFRDRKQRNPLRR